MGAQGRAVYTGAGRERGAGAGEPAELGAPVREAAGVAGAAAALPQRAHLRLVRRPAARRAQHPGWRPIPALAAGEFAIDRSIAHGAGRVSRGDGGKALAQPGEATRRGRALLGSALSRRQGKVRRRADNEPIPALRYPCRPIDTYNPDIY